MQFIRESTRKHTLKMVTLKVTGHVLPPELAQTVYGFLVEAGNIVPEDKRSMEAK